MNQDKKGYTLSVGIECHVQLKTKSKLFSGADNDARQAEPNTLVNHIDFGLPGALPVLNKEAISLASRAAFALNSTPQKFSKFDRKHYFYPDLPMGYQISQYDEPIVIGGYVEFMLDGGGGGGGDQLKRVNITRAHLEADAGKSIHPVGTDYSLVDLNRAGTPLLEIVSEPDMHTAAEAKGYAQELYLLMRYAEVSDANLFYGNMRFDVNVSVSKTDQLGTRSETKNLNSFRSVEKAIEFEMKRQIELLEDGQTVVQETRGWDDSKNQTYSMRSKENADDYRYMPDPDIPPVELDDQYIESVKASMPTMPGVWRQKLTDLGLDASISASLTFSEVEYGGHNLDFLISQEPDKARVIANWIVNVELPLRHASAEQQDSAEFISDDKRQKLYLAVQGLVKDGKLNSSAAKRIIGELLQTTDFPSDIEAYSISLGLIQNSDSSELGEAVKQVLEANAKAASDVKGGELKAIGFLVGQVMKLSKGQANPSLVADLIKQQLEIKD